MKRIATPALILATLLLAAPSLRAEFLVLRINESTAESISHWLAAFGAILIVLTLKKSRSKGGQGH